MICAAQQVNLSANAGGGVQPYQYGWLPGPMVGASQTVTPTSTTTYTVAVTDANGCTASTTTTVQVNPVPVATVSSDIVAGCAPVCINFSDASTVAAPGVITAWDWDFGDGSQIDNTQNPSHCYNTPGQYTVTLQVKTADGCVNTIVMTNYIEAWVVPVADFTASPQPTTIFNAEIFFTDLSVNASQWTWSFGDVFASQSTDQNPSFTYLEPNCYLVQLDVATSNGCTATDTMSVCLDGDVAIYVPNAFTPNGNGLNEIFIPLTYGIDAQKYEFWVFDRWGNLIFHTTDINEGWDGTLNGTKCQIDTYVYRVYAWDVMGIPHRVIGGVSLIR
jgi:gliding motility-associated-like protein